MDKDTLARLAALDLSTDPYQEAKNLIYQLQRIGAIEYSLHLGKTLTRGRLTNALSFESGEAIVLRGTGWPSTGFLSGINKKS